MLSDRHMYAANKLMASQFPDIDGFHSTMLAQSTGFPPISIGGGYMQDGNIIEFMLVYDGAFTLVFKYFQLFRFSVIVLRSTGLLQVSKMVKCGSLIAISVEGSCHVWSCRLLRCMVHWLTPMDCWSLLLLYSSSHHIPSTVGHCALWQHTMQLRATTWLRLHLMNAKFVNTW